MSDYPDPEALERIKAWPGRVPAAGEGLSAYDWEGLMALVKSEWWSADWGWNESVALTEWSEAMPGVSERRYDISTGGWSGNEDLIDALMENHLFWMLNWVSSRRGGHYEFRVRVP